MKKIKTIALTVLAVATMGMALIPVKAMALPGLPGGNGASGAVDNDMVVGFLMGFAENNTTSGGNFLSGLTGSALTGGLPMGGTGGIPGGVSTTLDGGALNGNVLGSAFGSVFNGTGVSSSNPMQSMITGYLSGQIMAQTHNQLAQQGLNLGDTFYNDPVGGLPFQIIGGAGETGVSSVVTALLGNNATAGAIASIMNGDFLGNSANNALSGIQAGAISGLIQSLGASGNGNALGVLSNLGLASLGTSGGLSALGSVGGVAALGALNSTEGLAALTGGLTSLGGFDTTLGSLLSGENNALIDSLTESGMMTGLSGLDFGSIVSSVLGNSLSAAFSDESFSALLANAQNMLTNGNSFISSVLGGNMLGGVLSNVLNNNLGSVLGGGLGGLLGGGLDNIMGTITGAMTSITDVVGDVILGGLTGLVGGGLGSVIGGGLGGLLGGGSADDIIIGIVGGTIGDLVGGGTGLVSGLLACGVTGGGTPTTPGGTPPSGGGSCTPGQPNNSGWTEEQCRQAARIAETDDAETYYCSRGTANILAAMGVDAPRAGTGVNGNDWYGELSGRDNWDMVSGSDCQPEGGSRPALAEHAQGLPNGSVMTYDDRGATTGSSGARYGHVEIKCTIDGQTVYISDQVRYSPGGSVPDRYTGSFTTGG